jgi:transcriptional regulator with XRE-family HTH domain
MRSRLGKSIRALRLQHRLTLVQLAIKTDLSHPFLSQLERGLARPSMSSLHRIARALGTTQPALMSMDTDAPVRGVCLVRAGMGVSAENPGGVARSLVTGSRAFYPIVFDGAESTFGEYFTHPGDEFIVVLGGRVNVDLAGEDPIDLGVGDSLYYPGGLAHRWRSIGKDKVRVLVVQEGRGPHS